MKPDLYSKLYSIIEIIRGSIIQFFNVYDVKALAGQRNCH
jgi:hypothetical protein